MALHKDVSSHPHDATETLVNRLAAARPRVPGTITRWKEIPEIRSVILRGIEACETAHPELSHDMQLVKVGSEFFFLKLLGRYCRSYPCVTGRSMLGMSKILSRYPNI